MERRKLLVLFSGFFAVATVLVSFSSVGFAQSVSISVSTVTVQKQKIEIANDEERVYWFCADLDKDGQLLRISKSYDSCETRTDYPIDNDQKLRASFFEKKVEGRSVKNIVALPYNSFVVSVGGNTSYYCSSSACYPH